MAKNFRGEDFVIGSKEDPIRFSFTRDLFTARANEEGGPAKFGVTLIIPKKSQWMKVIAAELEKVAKAKFGPDAMTKLKNEVLKNPILDGGGKQARSKKTGEFQGGLGPDVFFIRASTGFAPGVFNFQGQPAKDDSEFYSGVYGKASIHFYTWEGTKQGDGISVGINLAQMLKHGERLAGAGPDISAFVERVTDVGPAPEETKGGAGAAALFGEEATAEDIPW